MNTFHVFLRNLELLEWKPAGYVDPHVSAILAEIGREPRVIYEAVNSWSAKSLDKLQLSCHETSTHYELFLDYHKKLRFKIWLHQYKPVSERRLGYAEVPHNHRYSLASAILSGGFVHHYFERTGNVLSELIEERQRYTRGDVYVVEWQRVHKLSELMDRTVTLVIESPAVRYFSEAFYADPSGPRIFYDFVGLYTGLSREIDSI